MFTNLSSASVSFVVFFVFATFYPQTDFNRSVKIAISLPALVDVILKNNFFGQIVSQFSTHDLLYPNL